VAGVTILSGPIGAGKTAVSKELIGLLSGPLATIEGDQFWPFLVKRAEGDRREGFRVIMRAMTSAAGSFVRTDYDVLLDFSIPPAFLPIAQKILRDAPLNYIVLCPPLEICAARARDRAEGKIMKYDRASTRCLPRRSGTRFPSRARAPGRPPRSSSRGWRRAVSGSRQVRATRHRRACSVPAE
jgi:hypothetical protein